MDTYSVLEVALWMGKNLVIDILLVVVPGLEMGCFLALG
jgi:hypothetical protein